MKITLLPNYDISRAAPDVAASIAGSAVPAVVKQ
jgi:hypothetical protein